MNIMRAQTHKVVERQGDFIVLLNTDGVIAYSNQAWINYCKKHQLLYALWKVGENYLHCLEKMKKSNELECINDVLAGTSKEKMHLSMFSNPETTNYFSVKYQQFSLDSKTKGLVLHKQLVTGASAVSSLNTEMVLESMADAFYLLDNQMRFCFLNAESEKVLQRKKEELIGRNIWSCFPIAVGTKFYSNYVRAMHEQIPLQFEEYFALLDAWFSVKVTPVKDGGLAIYYRMIKKEDKMGALLSQIPYNDYLTGWPTRRKFTEKTERVLQEASTFSILYINLDNFKHINTLYNHNTGDEVLENIAKNIEKLLYPGDLTGRLDSDELILLRLFQEDEQLADFLEKLKKIFIQPIILEDFRSITVSASIGVSSYPQDTYSAEELIAFAETAMRAAKKQIGSSFSIFHAGMGIDLNRRLMIEKSLEGDLQELGFHFVVQPQVNCETGDLAGIEVLSRWNHPTLGPISPVEFIGIAEETGTISRLTTHLLKEVFSFIKDREKYGESFPKTAINVTSSLVTSKTFFEDLFFLMKSYQISPGQIELEITESVELTYSELTLANLMVCRSKGISIALDDFGTGFSMLAYLVDYPIDKIKLDKSFINKIGKGAKSEAVLKSLIQFIKGIDCELLAEGVETAEDSMFLQANGCSIHQGYLHDKPLAPEAFDKKYLKSLH